MLHLSESTLEDYTFGRLSSYRVERIEEHLLICSECQDRLRVEIEFATAMNTAAKKIAQDRDGHACHSKGRTMKP